ncbi:MAG TPA: hypothetical protein VHU42_15240 [Rhodopila sp.]|nr:hypothetical protein [Rhodopila sp.]
MLMIRLSKTDWAKAWRAMIAVAPVRLIRSDPVYEVLPAHLELLNARGFAYQVVPELQRMAEGGRHASN